MMLCVLPSLSLFQGRAASSPCARVWRASTSSCPATRVSSTASRRTLATATDGPCSVPGADWASPYWPGFYVHWPPRFTPPTATPTATPTPPPPPPPPWQWCWTSPDMRMAACERDELHGSMAEQKKKRLVLSWTREETQGFW